MFNKYFSNRSRVLYWCGYGSAKILETIPQNSVDMTLNIPSPNFSSLLEGTKTVLSNSVTPKFTRISIQDDKWPGLT